MTATLNIVGAGKVGRVLGRLFAQRGVFAVQDVVNRSLESAQEAVRFIGAGRACASLAAMLPAQVVLLAVSDTQLAPVAAQLAAHLRPGTVVFHCSGAQPA
ncbi:MAG TPA: NAD(P)-binding domain-containing protein, partial [Burkholderiaceae bacterium]